MNSIVNASSYIRQVIPNWYNYHFDFGFSGISIRDGGYNMFDYGNYVNFIIKLLFCILYNLNLKKYFTANKNQFCLNFRILQKNVIFFFLYSVFCSNYCCCVAATGGLKPGKFFILLVKSIANYYLTTTQY